jgi:hypothetical protein
VQKLKYSSKIACLCLFIVKKVILKGRRKINEWKWEKDKIEEVKEFKYLGYVMNETNTAAAHVRELVSK